MRLYEDNDEIESRIQLDDGSFGWSLVFDGFKTTLSKASTYTLIAENQEGKSVIKRLTVRVKAPKLRGKYTIQQKSNDRFEDAHEGSNDNSVVTRNKQKKHFTGLDFYTLW